MRFMPGLTGPESSHAIEIDAVTLATVQGLVAQNHEVRAIKAYRDATKASLRDAVRAVKQIKKAQGTP